MPACSNYSNYSSLTFLFSPLLVVLGRALVFLDPAEESFIEFIKINQKVFMKELFPSLRDYFLDVYRVKIIQR